MVLERQGITPVDREQILKRLPDGRKEKERENPDVSGNNWAATLQTYLQQSRAQDTGSQREEKKLSVPAGKGVQADALEEYASIDYPKDPQPCSSKQGQQKEVSRRNIKRNRFDSSEVSDDVISLQDSDAELILNDFTGDNFDEPPSL